MNILCKMMLFIIANIISYYMFMLAIPLVLWDIVYNSNELKRPFIERLSIKHLELHKKLNLL